MEEITFAVSNYLTSLENHFVFRCVKTNHYYRWRAAYFDLCSALMAIEQWEFFSVSHLLWHGTSVFIVISEDPWHSHLLPSVWQWCCYHLCLRHRSVAAEIRTPNIPLAGPRLSLTAPPPRLIPSYNSVLTIVTVPLTVSHQYLWIKYSQAFKTPLGKMNKQTCDKMAELNFNRELYL